MEENGAYTFVRGSDPKKATCRGKLQSKRCKLNQEINKEMRLRAGAENLFKATTSKKLRDTIAVELSFVNSNLQLLKEQLAELNSSVETYQNDSRENIMLMIPLGLKETNEVNFLEPFSDFILEHYSDDPGKFTERIADLNDTRQGARTPTRDQQGIALLFRYYNLLYYVERRFFAPNRHIGVYFEWYDSLTGVPSCQRTVAFEKACILFNLGAIYTQIGAKQERSSEKGLELAVDNFLRAAGTFRHISDTFTNAPSMDLKPLILDVFVALMLAQARECLYEKLRLRKGASITDSLNIQQDLAGEAAQLSQEYADIHKCIRDSETESYIPECWIGVLPLKAEYYKALSHYHFAKQLQEQKGSNAEEDSELKANVRAALSGLEESQRLQRLCRFLKNKTQLARYLRTSLESINKDFDSLKLRKEDSDISDSFDAEEVAVKPDTKFKISLTGPDFSLHKVTDPFNALGPIAIFSARRHWTAPRTIRLKKAINSTSCRIIKYNDVDDYDDGHVRPAQSFGFQLKGAAPVLVASVEPNSLADLGGIKEGDYIVEVMQNDVKWCTHEEVGQFIQESGIELEMKVVTPLNRSALKMGSLSTLSISGSSVVSGDSSDCNTTSHSHKSCKSHSKHYKNRTGTFSSSGWNIFRRSNSLGKIFS